MIIDYRSPDAGTHRVKQVMQQLLAVHAFRWTGVTIKLLLGVPLSLVGPLILTAIALGVEREWNARVLPGFIAMMAIIAVVLVPLLMLIERRTRGDFLGDALSGTDSSRPSSYGEFELRAHRTIWLLLTEFTLYGPRLLWGAIDAFKNRTLVDAPLRYVAAQVVVELLDQGEGMKVRELVGPDRPGPMLVPALRFLQECDWVDLSRRRDRVWLRSPIRNRLANL